MFKLPAWTVPAICFNNTTALPLLLVQSLFSAGILDTLLKDYDDTTSEAVKRAKSYFVVSAVVGNALTFTMGPRLLDGEESPDAPAEDDKKNDSDDEERGRTARDEEEGRNSLDEDGNERPDEETTLLPRPLDTHVLNTVAKAAFHTNTWFNWLPAWAQKILSGMGKFVNAPIVGAAIGAFLGLIPGLHKLLFSEPDEGGIFKAWLTQSVENIGDLFASLQLVVVGSKLSTSLLKAKRGEDSGKVGWKPLALIFFIRFLLWPAPSISTIYFFAAKTNLLDKDPILWFVMMLMPTAPPATKLAALVDVSGAGEKQKLAISKSLTIGYAASPVICVAVVGSLKAVGALSEAKA